MNMTLLSSFIFFQNQLYFLKRNLLAYAAKLFLKLDSLHQVFQGLECNAHARISSPVCH